MGAGLNRFVVLSLAHPVALSHRQDRCHRQVTFYGESEWLPFMGAISTLGTASNTFDGADRYPPMGIDEGSKLWEKTAVVLQGTTNPPDHPDSARLPPWMGTFVVANLVPGLRGRPGKVAAFGRPFWQKVDGYGASRKSMNQNFSFHI